ncbi:dihydrodipicolinate synthase family protein [Alphaproteobacteria bacterium]|nr:dihydrodipicolinate synthase family protein [Alphaproteobacteria bacterium]
MLKGIIPMTYCFFNKNNSLDLKAIRDQLLLIKQLGSHGIACLGLATEVNKLNFFEKKKIIELVAEVSNDSLPIVITISGNQFNEYKKLIEVAEFYNARWIVFQPWLKKNIKDDDCFDFFNKIIPNVDTNTLVGIQNAKEYIGVGLNSSQILKLYKKFDNFRAIKGEASATLIQTEIKKYPKNLQVFNGRGGQEIIDNFLAGCSGIIPSLEGTDIFLKIYKLVQQKKIIEARRLYKKILPSIVFSMQSIDSLVCYGKRICAYRMGIKKIYDRKPALVPTNFGIKLAKQFAEDLGKFT